MDTNTNLKNSRNHFAPWENEKTEGKRKTSVPIKGGLRGSGLGKLAGKFYYITRRITLKVSILNFQKEV